MRQTTVLAHIANEGAGEILQGRNRQVVNLLNPITLCQAGLTSPSSAVFLEPVFPQVQHLEIRNTRNKAICGR